MPDIHATVRLRPTRIGFLVRPTDMPSVRKIMRACACLWGGIYCPIIPVFRVPPKEWRPQQRFERVKGLAIARGYVDFFEPDVFVEAEAGLLEEVGLGKLRERHTLNNQVTSLKDFLTPRDNRDWSEPAFGLGVGEVLRHLYESERRFVQRDEHEAVLVKPERTSAVVEALFGAYPTQRDLDYLAKGYKDVFKPKQLSATPETWLEIYRKRAQTPLGITQHDLDAQRYWHHDPVVFVFDPTKPTDLIDLWNLRLEPHPVFPVPKDWFESLADPIRKFLIAQHRPVRGNSHGVMHRATIEYARSLGKNEKEALLKSLGADLPEGTLCIKDWRTQIWVKHNDDFVHRERRLLVTAAEQRVTIPLQGENDRSLRFEALAPDFAERYGGHECRWVNAVQLSRFGPKGAGLVFPFNTYDRSWPRFGLGLGQPIIGSEGWVFTQRYKNSDEHLTLLTKEEAIAGALKRLGVEAKLSEPGHIAKQMLDHLGSLWGVHLLADMETLHLLNKMAGGLRRKANETETVEESFERRSAPLKDWTDLISRRTQRGSLPRLDLSDFTQRNIIRLGLETDCPHCQATNWHSLTATDYRLTCERCLNTYEFPQAALRTRNANWYYRVVGPFSVPDYGRGSYSALLTLRFLGMWDGASSEMTFSTAMNLEFDGVKAEADLVALWRKEQHGVDAEPALIIGETKSLGQGDLIKADDLAKLKSIATKLPGTYIVISVLRNHFTDAEKAILKPFAQWCRRLDAQGQSTNPVLLLTTNELFMKHFVSATWKDLGEPHKSFTEHYHTRNLTTLADATLQIYLGLPSFHKWQESQWKKKAAKKKSLLEGSKRKPAL